MARMRAIDVVMVDDEDADARMIDEAAVQEIDPSYSDVVTLPGA